MKIVIDGIAIEITKKRIKNIHLYVRPHGVVSMTVPFGVSDESVMRFVRAKLDWVKKHLARQKIQEIQNPVLRYVSGETLYVFGTPYVLQVANSNRNSLTLADGKAILSVKTQDNAPEKSTILAREKIVKQWYRTELKAKIECLLPRWEAATGLKASSYQIKDMKTRWGTCNCKTAKLWFSLNLAKKPLICLEYIILHELTHLKERTHNATFKALLDKQMKDWRQIKRLLNA